MSTDSRVHNHGPSNIPGGRRLCIERIINGQLTGDCILDQEYAANKAKVYNENEQNEATRIFSDMLHQATKDGGIKRRSGEKVDWKVDKTHEPAIFSHLNKWKHGELVDADSGQHPLVHLAWRALAIAYQETHSEPDYDDIYAEISRAYENRYS